MFEKVVNLESEEDFLKKTRGDIGVAHNNVGTSQSCHLTVERGMVGMTREHNGVRIICDSHNVLPLG